MNIYEVVQIIDADKGYENFIGQEGLIIGKDSEHSHPYEIVFFNKEYQKISMKSGILLWRESDLEVIE